MQECSLERSPGCARRVALVPPQWSHCSGDPQSEVLSYLLRLLVCTCNLTMHQQASTWFSLIPTQHAQPSVTICLHSMAGTCSSTSS